MRERRDHLGHAIGVHVGWLNGYQRAQTPGGLDDDLRYEPRIELAVVSEDQDAFVSRRFASASELLQLSNARAGLCLGGKRTGGKDLQAVIGSWHIRISHSQISLDRSIYSSEIADHDRRRVRQLIHSAHDGRASGYGLGWQYLSRQEWPKGIGHLWLGRSRPFGGYSLS